jgi:alpha-L-rhamnosidase
MKKYLPLSIVLLLFCLCSCTAQVLHVQNLQCGNTTNPVGINANDIRLSWQITSDKQNVIQTAYRLMVADSRENLTENMADVWDSGKVPSSQSIQVLYKGKKLSAGKIYYWTVTVWTNKNSSAISNIAIWQTGLFTKADWKGAQWIGYEDMTEKERQVPFMSGNANPKGGNGKDVLPLLRKEVTLNKPVKQATVFISGLGQFELSLNGQKISDHFLDPGWTKYDKQALYVTFDITKQLKQGVNALGVMLGNGFYHIPHERYRKMTGAFGNPKMICRLLVEYQDGSTSNMVSNTDWKAAPGPITFSSEYGGEDYDARLEQANWNSPGFKDAGWKNAITVNGPPLLDAQLAPPLKVFNKFKAVTIKEPKPGVWVYDFGQNASGIPAISVSGQKGNAIKITAAELLDDKGMINQKPSGSPSWFTYTLKGEGIENWQPQFMYYGFKFLQIEGAVPEGQPNPQNLPGIKNLTSLHTRNSAVKVGSFECSNPLFNRIYKLIDWSVKSNMSSVLTDCPHREKLGWLEVPQLLGNSLRYNYDIATFYRKILADIRVSQLANGLITSTVPDYVEFGKDFRDSPEWGSSSVILPWELYQWYGDKSVLSENFDMMKRYVDYLESQSKNHIVTHGLGDWFDIGPNGSGSGYSLNTPQGITGTSTYYYDLTIMAKVASLLGYADDAKKYQQLANETRAAFNAAFFNKDTKQYGTGSQTANAMAVHMGLVEPQYKDAVVSNLVKDIQTKKYKLTAGEVGFKSMLQVLEDAGRSDIIFAMNNRDDVPGYGYQLAHGTTTLMEDWQAIRSLGNNHCMLGHLLGWFYSGLAGIREGKGAIAFNKIDIHPEVVGDITYAKATHQSPYGLIKSEWKKNAKTFELNVEIPVNTKADIYLPVQAGATVLQNGKVITAKAITAIGSGSYKFVIYN